MVTIVGDVTGPSAGLAPPPIKSTSPCREDQRLSTEGKIVSKYCNLSKSLEGEGSIHPFPLYHGGSLNLLVRRVERIGRCIECRCYRCNLWLTTLHICEQPATFPPTALKNRLRARQAEKSRLFRYIFVSVSSLWVHKHQVRGISCENCTAATKQGNLSSWASNSYKSKTEFGCDLDVSPGVNGNENNFGQYRLNTTNSAHRCSSSSASTTQHWLGSVYSL